MSVIAFDGKMVAADRRAVCQGVSTTAAKLFREPDGTILGYVGSLDEGLLRVEWYRDGADPEEFPEPLEDDDFTYLFVVKDGKFFRYERVPVPIENEDDFCAFGSGGPVAMGAMASGASALQAVEAACRLVPGCGNGVTCFEVE